MAEPWREPVDQAARRAALDPARSFIVQAPAGSGKTGLLTQRYLRLLAIVDDPEEIIAMTFTRKAAAEMRRRILEALAASAGDEPTEPWERETWQLARDAMQQARARDWKLLDNPQRLRIRTIDSLCQYLASQLPLRSGFGELPRIEEDAGPLYQAAARSTLAELDSDNDLGSALAMLLPHLDNDLAALHRLLSDMLGRRDQWLPVLIRPNRRAAVELGLQEVIEAHLRALSSRLPAESVVELPGLVRYATDHLDADHPLRLCRHLDPLPPLTADGLTAWRALADLLLTRQGHWRKGVNVRQGFPPGGGAARVAKEGMLALLETFRSDEDLAGSLDEVRRLPDPEYPDEEWLVIEALFTVLRGAAAHLSVIFREQGAADFIETALAARAALGGELEPSDLVLRLDYRLQHLLVDEFQDTSQSQHELLIGLTSGWQEGDGRTLFLVGDPMQSIYRFRKAEVGLFLDAWEGRLGDLHLEPLRLGVNFRSDRGVMEWVNQCFPRVFPTATDKLSGAVPYTPAEAFRPAATGAAVDVHPLLERDDGAEASLMLELIRMARAEEPEETAAVLVRGKAHLAELLPALRASGLRFQAVEIGALAQQPAVLDLLALTRAMLHRADRVSWLALLHGPLCGLSLADLHALAGTDHGGESELLPDLLADPERLARMSEDGRARAVGCNAWLQPALEGRGRQPLREWIEGVWLGLGGPATLPDQAAAEDVEVCLRLLERLDDSAGPVVLERLRDEVEKLFAMPDPEGDERLQLMTIHKAKGLEFDTVILPGLGKTTRSDRKSLLYWQEAVSGDGKIRLLFGPVKPAQSLAEPRTSAYIRQLQSRMSMLESGRLLYVAATRARRHLHLIGHARPDAAGDCVPAAGSLLQLMWSVVGEKWQVAARTHQDSDADERSMEAVRPVAEGPIRWRLPGDWTCPEPPANAGQPRQLTPETGVEVVYEWAGNTARSVGTVVHAWLQRLVQLAARSLEDVHGFEEASRRMLLAEGVPGRELEVAAKRVREAVRSTLADERGQWILSSAHRDSRCEVPLSALIEGRLHHVVVDRSFIDREGARWVIDYKTGIHEGADASAFLDEEAQRYRAQLSRYVAAYRALEERPVRAALYYPLVPGGWRELSF